MKEPKFRVFIEEDKKFIYSDEFSSLSNFFKEYEWLKSVTNTKLNQSTGLKDKKGKEIYEGDIILCDSKIKSIIEFKDGCFLYKDYEDNYWAINGSFVKVIGNIFENKKLLEVKND